MVIFIINILRDYYDFNNYKIYKDNNKNIIKYRDKIYYLEKIYDPYEVYEQYMLVKDIPYFYKFILNINNSIITEYNDNNYVLLEINDKRNYNYPVFITENIKLNWRNIWIEKSDYIENYYNKIRDPGSLIDESFDYYIGLLEFAIFYLGEDNEYYGNGYLQHKTFNYDEMNNPLNIKVDFLERDFAEYLKYLFISKEYKNVDMHELIFKNRYNYNFNLVIARVIYPNYYFNLLDEVIADNLGEDALVDIIKRNEEFEAYIKNIINEISVIYPIKKISFMRF